MLSYVMKNGFLDYDGMCAETTNILSQLGVSFDARGRVKYLSVAYQQIVEIAKAVSRNVRLLILDEPSAPLTSPEIEAMFRIIRRLRKSGVTILYISHRLEEIFEIPDRVTVMRDGEYITTLPVGETDRNGLISLMVGAKQEIYKLMRDLSEGGVSIIMISSEMPELIGMSNRIVVMNEGQVVGEVMAADATQEMILEMASTKVEEAARR